MEKRDGPRFKELLAMISVTYESDFTQTKSLLWWNLFRGYSLRDVEKAVLSHIACPDYGMHMPKPANIMKFISGTTKQLEQAVDDKAEIAWHVILGEIRRIGSYGSLKMEDKQALAAVQAIGGWKNLCGLTIDKMTWAHKEFIAAYQNYERADLAALPNKLPGRIHLENHKKDQQGPSEFMQGLSDYRNRKGIENK